MNKITEDNIGKLLTEYIPEFLKDYKNFLKDNDGEKIIHVLFGAYLFPFTIKSIKNKKISTLKRIGKFLSKCFKFGDEKIVNIIHVSFFENMKKEDFEKLVTYLSEELSVHMKEMDRKYKYFI
ncbi:MAG: hypothetical protein AABX11_06210 [Nanoarchaeota archaeon]